MINLNKQKYENQIQIKTFLPPGMFFTNLKRQIRISPITFHNDKMGK
jgi:hypothetical protein